MSDHARPSAGLFVFGSELALRTRLLDMGSEIGTKGGQQILYRTIAIELGARDTGRVEIYSACLWPI